ncbi:MAG: penicillin-binding protein 1A [Alphaproteobacteria bacterium]|nr:penicillin-binding protein 1A [Alphaproteobacteria bacterium]
MKKHFFVSVLASIAGLLFLVAFLVLGAAFFVIVYYTGQLPDYKQLANYEPIITTRFYASDGQLLAEYASEKRIFVPITAVPKLVINAFLSAEDKNFYKHNGIDYYGIARAVLSNVKNRGTGRRLVGASTITQQVAKNFFLSPEMSFSRKIKEALLARRIEQAFDKEHILELYMNQIYLGRRSYGVASAGLMYFDKSLDELTLAEAAFLAALPKGPNNYDPDKNYNAAFARRNYVLDRMYENGYATAEEVEKAKAEPIKSVHRALNDTVKNADYYNEEIRRIIEQKYGESILYQGGLSVRTSLDPRLQNIAVDVLEKGLFEYDKRHGYRGVAGHIADMKDWQKELAKQKMPSYYPTTWKNAVVLETSEEVATIGLPDGSKGQILLKDIKWARKWLEGQRLADEEVNLITDVMNVGDVIYVSEKNKKSEVPEYSLQQYPQVEGAVVALDPHTGRILAMAGGISFAKSQFNRAVQAYRQPGSSFKPFVYLTALDSGFTPSTLILDAPMVVDQGPGLEKWKPKNYTNIFYGPSTLRTGIEKSRNLMTVRLAQTVGIEKTVEYAKKFGISDNLMPVLAMSLGSGETTLLKLTLAYGMLVNGGKKITPNLIDRIQDRTGKTIYKHDTRACPNCNGAEATSAQVPELADDREQIQDPISAYQMVNIMTGVVERGTGKIAQTVKRTLAGKSGTSNDSFDTWFIGFSPDLVVGVFVGFDEPQTLGPHDTGSVVAAPIFRDFMMEALKDKPDIPFRIPEGVRMVRVDAKTGKPVKVGTKDAIWEAFRKETNVNEQTPIIGQDVVMTPEEEPDLGGLY